MTEAVTPDLVAAEIRQVMWEASNESERSLQAADNRLGVSDLGMCHERVRRMVLQIEPDEPDRHYLAAFVGTAVGDHLEQEVAKRREGWLTQQELVIPLPEVSPRMVGRSLLGHADLLHPGMNLLLDAKAPGGFATVKGRKVKLNYQFQRHLYAWGAIRAGLLQEEGCLVGNVFIDRTADDEQPYVDLEPFSMDVVIVAAQWLDDVFYAVFEQEEAQKDPPIEFCAEWCGYYLSCRALDRKIEGGLITDEDHLVAIKIYTEAQREEKEAAKRKAAAKRALLGVSGSDGTHAVKWLQVDEAYVAPYTRAAYQRLAITPIRRT